MSPLEAAHLGTSLLYQKAFNKDFQLSEAESRLGTSTREQLHATRTQTMKALVNGSTDIVSVRDMITYADELFTNLGSESRTEALMSGAVPNGGRK